MQTKKKWRMKNGDWYLSSSKHKRGDKQNDHKNEINLFVFCVKFISFSYFSLFFFKFIYSLIYFSFALPPGGYLTN